MAPLSSGVEETFACAKCTFAYPVFQPFAAGTASGSSAMLPCSQVVALGAPQCSTGQVGQSNTPGAGERAHTKDESAWSAQQREAKRLKLEDPDGSWTKASYPNSNSRDGACLRRERYSGCGRTSARSGQARSVDCTGAVVAGTGA
jgi:hypothetical protein